jgi:hypothetical protein
MVAMVAMVAMVSGGRLGLAMVLVMLGAVGWGWAAKMKPLV